MTFTEVADDRAAHVVLERVLPRHVVARHLARSAGLAAPPVRVPRVEDRPKDDNKHAGRHNLVELAEVDLDALGAGAKPWRCRKTTKPATFHSKTYTGGSPVGGPRLQPIVGPLLNTFTNPSIVDAIRWVT